MSDTSSGPSAPAETPFPLHHLIESLLFVASEPVSVAQLAQVLEVSPALVEVALEQLGAEYDGRGIRMQRHRDRLQLVSAPEASQVVARFLGIQASARLSSAALEVLAIVAHRQPVTRSQIDAIRGVDSSSVLRVLLARSLITEAGRLETVGRPILYITTPEFLQQFGLTSLDELPPLPETEDQPPQPVTDPLERG